MNNNKLIIIRIINIVKMMIVSFSNIFITRLLSVNNDIKNFLFLQIVKNIMFINRVFITISDKVFFIKKKFVIRPLGIF